MKKNTITLIEIGKKNWIKKLTLFLKEHDVKVEHINFNTTLNLAKKVKYYYRDSGSLINNNFIYSFYKPTEFINPINNNLSNFKDNNKNNLLKFINYSENSSNKDIRFYLAFFLINLLYLVPPNIIKIFKNFNQHIDYELKIL